MPDLVQRDVREVGDEGVPLGRRREQALQAPCEWLVHVLELARRPVVEEDRHEARAPFRAHLRLADVVETLATLAREHDRDVRRWRRETGAIERLQPCCGRARALQDVDRAAPGKTSLWECRQGVLPPPVIRTRSSDGLAQLDRPRRSASRSDDVHETVDAGSRSSPHRSLSRPSRLFAQRRFFADSRWTASNTWAGSPAGPTSPFICRRYPRTGRRVRDGAGRSQAKGRRAGGS